MGVPKGAAGAAIGAVDGATTADGRDGGWRWLPGSPVTNGTPGAGSADDEDWGDAVAPLAGPAGLITCGTTGVAGLGCAVAGVTTDCDGVTCKMGPPDGCAQLPSSFRMACVTCSATRSFSTT